LYEELTRELGNPAGDRVEAAATPEQKERLARLAPRDVQLRELAGEPVDRVLDRAPGNDAPIGGIKAISPNAWFAARPSGTEAVYKIYAESFNGEEHVRALLDEAQRVVDRALRGG
jgi:phosphoglucomutase